MAASDGGVLAIRSGRVATGSGWAERPVTTAGGWIVAPGTTVDRPTHTLDADGLLVAPGYLDLQLNGAFGIDLAREPGRVGEVAARLPEAGVTGWCPTLVTSPPDRIGRLVAADAAAAGAPGAARSLGLHLEGPVLNPARRGAHDARLLRAPADVDTAGWSRVGGVAMVTLAPELPGALELVAALAARGVLVSAGHTDATPADLDRAWTAGLRMVTHLCNAMPAFHHRAPGPVGWTLGHRRVTAGLIVDGAHLDPVAVAALHRALGPARTLLVSDGVGAAGLPGAPPVATLADGTLAGATALLDACVRNLVSFTGCSAAAAVRSATAVPARLLGRRDLGRVAPGCRADLTLLTPDLRVAGTVVGGVVSASLAARLTRTVAR